MKKYISKADEYLISLISSEKSIEFVKLPCDIARELVLYGKVFNKSYSEEDIQGYLDCVKDIMKEINFHMEGVFEDIIRSVILLS